MAAFRAPDTTCPALRFSAIRPMAAMMPIRYAGTFSSSWLMKFST